MPVCSGAYQSFYRIYRNIYLVAHCFPFYL
ncbi:hypothetical protein CNECB9_760020 [Cupriavidus necator]|uniref:Uncharacterized protein n=1 Tax=Cupriavidus necator TaxID=106590 RepID=A0A1K0J3P4_CUPNE|nr:hypothetical protein CNECB9_760020 [Cupriavidus necator]